MKRIKIFDTTLRDGEQSPGCSMHLSEKLEVALQLERLGVDVIEAGFAACSAGDFEAVRTIADAVRTCTVASLARAVKHDIDAAADALRTAAHPRIHIFIATSPLHREYKLKMTKEQILAKIREMVAYGKQLVDDIEFSCEDACRTELDFLGECCEAAIEAGATTLNIPDTVGYCTPDEVRAKVEWLVKNVRGIENVDISTHCHNDLGMATANSLAMVLGGATQIECCVNGIGERAGNAALEQIVMAMRTRKDFFDCYTGINTKELYKTSKLVSSVTGTSISPTQPIIGGNAYAHESGIHQHGVLANRETYEIIDPGVVGIPQNKIVLGKHSGKHAFAEHVRALGYELTDEQITEKFEAFKALTDRKKYVGRNDLEALLNDSRIEATYSLKDYLIACTRGGNTSAKVTIVSGDTERSATAEGNGPVDAAYKAINILIDPEIELADYKIKSVSDQTDALGEAVVKIRIGDKAVHGRAVSTDVVESSILAYIDGINKLLGI